MSLPLRTHGLGVCIWCYCTSYTRKGCVPALPAPPEDRHSCPTLSKLSLNARDLWQSYDVYCHETPGSPSGTDVRKESVDVLTFKMQAPSSLPISDCLLASEFEISSRLAGPTCQRDIEKRNCYSNQIINWKQTHNFNIIFIKKAKLVP